jgi:phage baseplate assembly protein W
MWFAGPVMRKMHDYWCKSIDMYEPRLRICAIAIWVIVADGNGQFARQVAHYRIRPFRELSSYNQ